MNIMQLITLATNRLAALNNARATANALGDISRLSLLDLDITETENTIEALRTLI
jgi:hypothetical protein